jgi:inosine-uridine nucleoside N-ribohydrolase
LTIVLIGPATVLAEAMRRDHQLPDFIREVQAMGGAIWTAGNVTPHAEFNVWFDPDAMASVLTSRIPVTLVPLDATETVTYDPLPLPKSSNAGFAGTHLAAYLERISQKRSPLRMWDEVLAAVVIDPTLIETVEETFLTVSTKRDAHYGEILSSATVPDGTQRPIRVVTKVRANGVRQLIMQLLVLP